MKGLNIVSGRVTFRYMVGSLNKKTGVMTLHKAEVYHMTPKVKGTIYVRI